LPRSEPADERSDGSAARSVDLSEVLAYLVHELRNPTFGISSTLDAWESTFTASEEQDEYLGAMRCGLERIDLTLDAVAVLVRGVRLEATSRSPLPTLETVARRARAEAGLRGVKLTEGFAPGIAPIEADFGMLSRALLLVAGAAVDRTMKDDTVEIAAETGEAGALTVMIRDARSPRHGDDVEALFAWKSGPGRRASFGLAVARRIVEAHGGTLDALIGPAGTVFTATLPAVAPRAGARR
jgi:signal transduction histidine kinase